MKRHTFLTITLALFLCFGMVGCENNDENIQKQDGDFELIDFSHSGCKNQTKGIASEKEFLELKAVGKHLKITHKNTIFNCCPDELFVTAKIKKNIITLEEVEKGASCNCICPYDLEYKTDKLFYGKYHIILKQYNENLIEFDLNFQPNAEKVIIINRKYQ